MTMATVHIGLRRRNMGRYANLISNINVIDGGGSRDNGRDNNLLGVG
jgi:hypothetical protein